MSSEQKSKVEAGYDAMADEYLSWAVKTPSARERYTDTLLDRISAKPSILEIGCGAGLPILRRLIDKVGPLGGNVTGIDISAKQIELARKHCPEAQLVQSDMSALKYEPETFDGVVAFYSIFHIPREEQGPMVQQIYNWLKPGGWFACSLGTGDNAETIQEFFGEKMFWSAYDVDKTKAMFETAGFRLELCETLSMKGDGLDKNDPDYGVSFLWILAQRQ